MAVQGTFIWLCSLAVLSSCAATDETEPQNCSSPTPLLENLKVAVECGENLSSAWSSEETATVLLTMRNLTDTLHKHQLRDCHGAEPQKCPEAEVPENGGLVCVTVDNKRYCKPLCNPGYDFGFLRMSRLYEECSEQTGYEWNNQHKRRNKLAMCCKSPYQITGAPTAYFPKVQDCLTTKSNSHLQRSIIEVFTTELENAGVQGKPQSACLVCGKMHHVMNAAGSL